MLSIEIGGLDVFVPGLSHVLFSRSIIVHTAGLEAAIALANLCGGERIVIPRGPGYRAKIWAMRRAGWTVGAIAREVGRVERSIYYILQGNCPPILPTVSPPPRRAKHHSPQSTDECPSGGGEAVSEPAASPLSTYMPLDPPLTGG